MEFVILMLSNDRRLEMNYFIIEGTLKNPQWMTDAIMQKHMAYSKEAMDKGLILMSGLKSNMSGGLFIMKSESLEAVQSYLDSEPLKLANIQEYRVIEFSPHYFNEFPHEWFNSLSK